MQTIVYGACQIITSNQPLGGLKSSCSNVALGPLGDGEVFGVTPFRAIPVLKGVPYLAIFAVLVGAYFLFLYNKTRHSWGAVRPDHPQRAR